MKVKVEINVVKEWLKTFKPTNEVMKHFKNSVERALEKVDCDFGLGVCTNIADVGKNSTRFMTEAEFTIYEAYLVATGKLSFEAPVETQTYKVEKTKDDTSGFKVVKSPNKTTVMYSEILSSELTGKSPISIVREESNELVICD